MYTKVVAASAVAVCVAFLLAAGEPQKQSDMNSAKAAVTMPAVQLVGQDSKIDTAKFVLVTNEDDWKKLWAEHTGVAPSYSPPRHAAPKIDFKKYTVIGMFNGKSTNTDGQIVESIQHEANAIRVRFDAASFQTSSPGGTGVSTTSFGLWVIEKTDKPIILETPANVTKGGHSGWKEVKRFETK